MDIVIAIVGVVVVAAMFAIAGAIMYRPDQAGARGILRAWGLPDRYVGDDGEEDGDES